MQGKCRPSPTVRQVAFLKSAHFSSHQLEVRDWPLLPMQMRLTSSGTADQCCEKKPWAQNDITEKSCPAHPRRLDCSVKEPEGPVLGSFWCRSPVYNSIKPHDTANVTWCGANLFKLQLAVPVSFFF